MIIQARATGLDRLRQLLLKNQSHRQNYIDDRPQACRLLTLCSLDLNRMTKLAPIVWSKHPTKITWVKNNDPLVVGQRQCHSASGTGNTNDKKKIGKYDMSQNNRTESMEGSERNELGAMEVFGRFFPEFIRKELPFTKVFSSFKEGKKSETENKSAVFSAVNNTMKELSEMISHAKRETAMTEVVEAASKSVVEIRIKHLAEADVFGDKLITFNGGCGVIFHEDGLILTCSDVMKDATRKGSTITVRLSNGRLFPGQVECIVPKSDLAIIRINKSGLPEAKFPALRLGNSGQVRAGETVAAIGNPSKLSTSVTVGNVSSVDRMGQEFGSPNKHLLYIQTEFATQFGGCGGPLLNMKGEVIGLNVRINKDAPGISFAVTSDHIEEFINNTFGSTKPGGEFSLFRHSRGLTLVSLTENILKEQPGNRFSKIGVHKGIFVQEVSPGSPAQSCGIEVGDVIIKFNNQDALSAMQMFESFKSVKPTQLVIVRRDGTKHRRVLHPPETSHTNFH